jgi:hypothetical protein
MTQTRLAEMVVAIEKLPLIAKIAIFMESEGYSVNPTGSKLEVTIGSALKAPVDTDPSTGKMSFSLVESILCHAYLNLQRAGFERQEVLDSFREALWTTL